MSTPPSARTGISDQPLRGIAYALLGIVFYSLLDGTAKWLVTVAPILQIVAIRSVFVLLLLGGQTVHGGGGLASLRPVRVWGLVARIGLSFVALISFFEALRHLPLATCIAISFAAPLFMTIASVVLLGEQVGKHRWTAIVIGFVGVLVITRPDSGGLASWPALLTILSSLFFALSQITTRWLAVTETDLRILFYQNLGLLVLSSWRCPSSGSR